MCSQPRARAQRRLRVPVVASAVLGLIMSLGSVGVAGASTLATGSGLITGTAFTVTGVEQRGSITILTASIQDQYSGFLSGTAVGTFRQITNSSTGSSVIEGTERCTCTVAGQAGTIQIRFFGPAATGGATQGNLVVEQGEGGLTGLHGAGTFEGNLFAPLPYTVTVVAP
mgnify:CR=1 FL=1